MQLIGGLGTAAGVAYGAKKALGNYRAKQLNRAKQLKQYQKNFNPDNKSFGPLTKKQDAKAENRFVIVPNKGFLKRVSVERLKKENLASLKKKRGQKFILKDDNNQRQRSSSSSRRSSIRRKKEEFKNKRANVQTAE